MSGRSRGSTNLTRKLVTLAAVVVVLVMMMLSTKFLTPGEAAKLNPAAFNAKTYVKDNFKKTAATLTDKATDIVVLAPAVDKDLAAAGQQYGVNVGSGKFAFPVKATGTASEVDGNFMVLTVPGVRAGDTIRVPLGSAVSGTPVRDATGDMTFSKFQGQTDFQSVANEFKARILVDVLGPVDVASLKGKKVTVTGAYSSGGPAKSFIIQPVSIEVAS